jgi:hypothetical protein
MFFEFKMIQGTLSQSRFENYIPTLTPVSSVRPAFGNKALTPETYTASSTISGLDGDHHFINEFHSA